VAAVEANRDRARRAFLRSAKTHLRSFGDKHYVLATADCKVAARYFNTGHEGWPYVFACSESQPVASAMWFLGTGPEPPALAEPTPADFGNEARDIKNPDRKDGAETSDEEEKEYSSSGSDEDNGDDDGGAGNGGPELVALWAFSTRGDETNVFLLERHSDAVFAVAEEHDVPGTEFAGNGPYADALSVSSGDTTVRRFRCPALEAGVPPALKGV
jgi:hypothetical protein